MTGSAPMLIRHFVPVKEFANLGKRKWQKGLGLTRSTQLQPAIRHPKVPQEAGRSGINNPKTANPIRGRAPELNG